MVKKTDVIVCDECDKGVAEGECNLCKKDLCGNCGKYLRIKCDKGEDHAQQYFSLYIKYCNNCYRLIGTKVGEFWKGKYKDDIFKIVVKHIEKSLIVESLEEEKK